MVFSKRITQHHNCCHVKGVFVPNTMYIYFFKIIASIQYRTIMHYSVACPIIHFAQSWARLTQQRSISAFASGFICPAVPAFTPIGYSTVGILTEYPTEIPELETSVIINRLQPVQKCQAVHWFRRITLTYTSWWHMATQNMAQRLSIQINEGTDLTPNSYSRHNFRFALSHAENGVDMPAITKIEC